ncbi:MAG: DegV family protein [Eubacteriales bacterium]|nr:DegV family protein [Eubacteriales bacterium]
MSEYIIVTDSVLDIDESWFRKNQVRWVPLSFTLEGHETIEDDFGKTIPLKEFYQELRDGKNVTTAQGTMGQFAVVFEEILQSGKDAVYIGFSSGLSGSYQSACMAADELREKYPAQHIYCVDTKAAAGGQTMLAREAVRCQKEGMPAEELARHIEAVRGHIVHWFTVDDLFYLHRGGRVSKSAAVMGSLVGIKPILFVDDEGHLIPDKKVRGRKNSVEELGRQMVKHMDVDHLKRYSVAISHGDCEADARALANWIRKNTPAKNIDIHILDTVIGAHSGPGTLALFFYGDKRGN